MRYVARPICKFGELSDKAKGHAIEQAKQIDGYPWSEDAMASIRSLAEHFGVRVTQWEVDWFDTTYSSMEFGVHDMEPMEPADIEEKLNELGEYNPETLKGLGDCKLTGFCMDESAIDGFRMAWHQGERDLEKLLQEAFREWLKDAQSDCEAQYEEEAFAEHCANNGYEFEENGDFYGGA